MLKKLSAVLLTAGALFAASGAPKVTVYGKGSEASFDTITFLSNKINELNLNYVLKLENSDDRIAKIIIDTSKKKNVQIITIDSLQSVKTDDINNGTTYLSVMESNLEVLKKALS